MSLESALAFFFAIFVFGVTPGPGVFAVLARALGSGARSCFFLALGMVISDIAYLVFACLGLAALAHNWGGLFTVVRWVGAAYLLWLGIGIWRAPVGDGVDGATVPPASRRAGFVQGFLISASNPKVILFYVAFLPSFMDLERLGAGDIVLAAALTLVALMAGLMLIAAGAARARRMFRSARAARALNRSAGAIMIGAGAYLASRSG
ncbi:MAG: LysE family translocator [Rhodocyclaceae bacterium]|nr:LysE family translocator [Rhodocyclaceae bacterium]